MNNVANKLESIVDQWVPQLRSIQDEPLTRRQRPDKWSRQEVLGHLIDSACNNHQKFVRMIADPVLAFPGYRQDEWVEIQQWSNRDWLSMVDFWAAYNRHLASMIRDVDPATLGHTIEIEGVGPFTLEFVMADYVEHLKHHLLQILPEADLTTQFKNVYHA